MRYSGLNDTSNFDHQSDLSLLYMLTNSGTVDSRAIIDTGIAKVYESEEIIQQNIYPANYVKSFLLKKQTLLSSEEAYIPFYQVHTNGSQDETRTSIYTNVLTDRLVNLAKNIGSKLFGRLNWDQKIFMARTAGIIEFEKRIDISATYSFVESHEL